jgi:hypothetical protein
MPRRDGDVFLFGTAMTVSPHVLLRSLPDRTQAGASARSGTAASGLIEERLR